MTQPSHRFPNLLRTLAAALTLVLCLAVAPTPLRAEDAPASAPAESKPAEGKPAASPSGELTLCLDDKQPCISEQADGCGDCAKGAVKKPYELTPMMEVVAKAMKGIRTDTEAKQLDAIPMKTAVIRFVAERIEAFQPPKNASDPEKYHGYAKQFLKEVESLERFAKEGDQKGTMGAFRVLSKTCTSCHQLYRE